MKEAVLGALTVFILSLGILFGIDRHLRRKSAR